MFWTCANHIIIKWIFLLLLLCRHNSKFKQLSFFNTIFNTTYLFLFFLCSSMYKKDLHVSKMRSEKFKFICVIFKSYYIEEHELNFLFSPKYVRCTYKYILVKKYYIKTFIENSIWEVQVHFAKKRQQIEFFLHTK